MAYISDLEDRFKPQYFDFGSIRGRFAALASFFKILFTSPFFAIVLCVKTFFKALGVAFGFLVLFASLGCSEGSRAFFIARIVSLAQAVAELCLFPFIVLLGLCKSFLGFLIHPALYFHI